MFEHDFSAFSPGTYTNPQKICIGFYFLLHLWKIENSGSKNTPLEHLTYAQHDYGAFSPGTPKAPGDSQEDPSFKIQGSCTKIFTATRPILNFTN